MGDHQSLGIYELPYAEVCASIIQNHRRYYADPEYAYCPPFRIMNNLYYVGDRFVCAHLIDTGDGLILFDAGYSHTAELQLRSIRALGFDPADIRYLILSHGHFDHFGACNTFRQRFGVKSFLSRPDYDMLKTAPAATLMELNADPHAELPVIDHAFEDGEIIRLGNTQIECVLSPGHSPGTTSFFFGIEENGTVYKVGYFGGTGFLTLYKDYLQQYSLPLSLQQSFKETLRMLRFREVDIPLGNHPPQNATFEKMRALEQHCDQNPFVAPSEWNTYLETLEAQYDLFLAKGY